jgi:hypothetical protein
MLKTDYSKDYVADLKLFCDATPRWDGTLHLWLIDQVDEEAAIGCIQKHFPSATYGEMEFVKKPDESAQQAAAMRSMATGAAAAALTMFTVAGKQSAKDVYSILVKRHHSDLHPEWTPAEKAEHDPICAAITTSWRELKAHMGW